MKARLVRNTPLVVGLAVMIAGCARDSDTDDSEIVVRSPNAAFVRNAGVISDNGVHQMREESCVHERTQRFLAAPVLSLVVDVSGSMSLAPQSGGESKWEVTRSALNSAIARLPEGVSLGVVFFPNQATTRNCVDQEGPCVVGESLDLSACINLEAMVPPAPLGPSGSMHRKNIELALEQVNPAGGTPTHDAIDLAISRLDDVEPEGERSLLLITDGQPTFLSGCRGSGKAEEPVDEDPVVRAIGAAFDQGIRSYLVGSPGSEENVSTGEDAREWLSEAAIEGGSAASQCSNEGKDYCHYDLSESRQYEQDLFDVLEDILGRVKSCSFSLPEAPPDMNLDLEAMNVALLQSNGAEVLVRSNDSGCSDGWYLDADQARIQLCSETCERRQGNLHSEVEIFLACNSTVQAGTK